MKDKFENKVIVEVGPNACPVFVSFDNHFLKNIGDSVSYFAFDSDLDEIEKFKRYYSEKGTISQCNIRDFPLLNESVDQIWFMNVFGDFRDLPRKLPCGALQYTLGVGEIFQELHRIIKKDGVIYIGETYHPMRDVSFLVESDFSDFGLEKKIYLGVHESLEFIKNMGGGEGFGFFDITKNYIPFFVELRKK